MSLAECGRFALLPQALVARSALEAAGLHPFVFDEFRASITWTEQFSLGGVRVMVPSQEVEAARALLSDLDRPATPPRRGVTAGGPSLLLLVLFLASLVIGWPIAGFRQPKAFHRLSALVVTLLMALIRLLPILKGLERLG